MSEWKKQLLDSLCSKVTVGHVGSMASQYTNTGIPFLRSLNIKPGKIDLTSIKHISPEFHEKLKKTQLQPGDIAIVRTGEPGAAAVIPDHLASANCSDIIIARAKPEVDTQFLCYAINETAKEFVRAHTVGAVQQHFNVSSAKNLPINTPPLKEQQAIAAALGALDEKIAANERISQAAAELATNTYTHATKKTPDHFTDTPLSSTAEFINGRAFTKNATGTGRMVIRIAEMNSGPGNSTVYNDIEAPEKHLANPGEILFAWSGSLTTQRWYRPQGIINQHIFKVVPKNDYPAWLAFELVKYKIADFQAIAADKATTMGHIQRRHLDETVPVPSPEMISQLGSSLEPLWHRALVAEQEALTLAELRDTLLPQLMSGKLRVKDAEKIVEDNV